MSNSQNGPIIQFICEEDHTGRLRVHINNANYLREANCQFPRAIRVSGQMYEAPATSISVRRGSGGTLFYHVHPKSIRVVSTIKIYGSENTECCICLTDICTRIFVPCGHFCVCATCASRVTTCPLCRAPIQRIAIGAEFTT